MKRLLHYLKLNFIRIRYPKLRIILKYVPEFLVLLPSKKLAIISKDPNLIRKLKKSLPNAKDKYSALSEIVISHYAALKREKDLWYERAMALKYSSDSPSTGASSPVTMPTQYRNF